MICLFFFAFFLAGLGVKASAFAIDDTQPGSIALQKRLEFCCAMSRPCSEETVDELVEKEVCVCVCVCECVCVCVCVW